MTRSPPGRLGAHGVSRAQRGGVELAYPCACEFETREEQSATLRVDSTLVHTLEVNGPVDPGDRVVDSLQCVAQCAFPELVLGLRASAYQTVADPGLESVDLGDELRAIRKRGVRTCGGRIRRECARCRRKSQGHWHARHAALREGPTLFHGAWVVVVAVLRRGAWPTLAYGLRVFDADPCLTGP